MCKHFFETYDSIKNIIQFKTEWVDEQGYFDAMVIGTHAPILDKPATCTDLDKRKIIILPTPVGNTVLFQRYTDSEIIVTNLPILIQHLGGPLDLYGILSPIAVQFLLGDKQNTHIGQRLSTLLESKPLPKISPPSPQAVLDF